MNLLAVVGKSDSRLRRVRVTHEVQRLLAEELERQKEEFVGEKERVAFDPRYKVDEDEVFHIPGYVLPDHLEEIGGGLHVLEEYHPEEISEIRALIGYRPPGATGRGMELCVQRFMKSQVLRRKRAFLLHGAVLTEIEEEGGILLAPQLAAYFSDDVGLLFRSYHAVNPILPLREYFEEATDDDVRQVISHPLFAPCDVEERLAVADTVMRRQFAVVKELGTLEEVSVESVVKKAREFRIELELQNGKIVFPKDKKRGKALLRLLAEAYFEGPLTGRPYMANSHRPVSG